MLGGLKVVGKNQYQVVNPEIQKLLDDASRAQWNYHKELDWNVAVDPENIAYNEENTFLSNLPEYKKMSSAQKNELRFKESGYHISNLLAGEYRAVSLSCSIMNKCYEENGEWSLFLSTITNDERNHFLVLFRYLEEKLGTCYDAHPSLDKLLDELHHEPDFAIQLVVSQVVLEWTAAALLASMLMRSKEMLLKRIISRILADEGRHLAFNKIVFNSLGAERIKKISTNKQDLLYDSIVACMSALLAVPVWKEFGISRDSCHRYVIEEFGSKGVFNFYSKVLPKKLQYLGIETPRLVERLERDLLGSLKQNFFALYPV